MKSYAFSISLLPCHLHCIALFMPPFLFTASSYYPSSSYSHSIFSEVYSTSSSVSYCPYHIPPPPSHHIPPPVQPSPPLLHLPILFHLLYCLIPFIPASLSNPSSYSLFFSSSSCISCSFSLSHTTLVTFLHQILLIFFLLHLLVLLLPPRPPPASTTPPPLPSPPPPPHAPPHISSPPLSHIIHASFLVHDHKFPFLHPRTFLSSLVTHTIHVIFHLQRLLHLPYLLHDLKLFRLRSFSSYCFFFP